MHAPLAKKIPGLQRYTVCRPDPDPQGNQTPYYVVAVLEFESAEAVGVGLSSPEGNAAAADLANFPAGVTLLTGPSIMV